MKENSPVTRVTCAGKRKLQTQQGIGDFTMGKLNEKGTTSRGKKLKMDEETNIHFDLDIKREFDELENYITIPVQSPTKQKKQTSRKKNAKGKK